MKLKMVIKIDVVTETEIPEKMAEAFKNDIDKAQTEAKTAIGEIRQEVEEALGLIGINDDEVVNKDIYVDVSIVE